MIILKICLLVGFLFGLWAYYYTPKENGKGDKYKTSEITGGLLVAMYIVVSGLYFILDLMFGHI